MLYIGIQNRSKKKKNWIKKTFPTISFGCLVWRFECVGRFFFFLFPHLSYIHLYVICMSFATHRFSSFYVCSVHTQYNSFVLRLWTKQFSFIIPTCISASLCTVVAALIIHLFIFMLIFVVFFNFACCWRLKDCWNDNNRSQQYAPIHGRNVRNKIYLLRKMCRSVKYNQITKIYD